MIMTRFSCLFLILFVPCVYPEVIPTPSTQDAARQAEPGLTYEQGDASALPKTLVFAVRLDNILDHAEEWKDLGVDGFFLNKVVREWSDNIWATDGKAWQV